ncbi:MAG TPA: type III pantothenate kinase [Polyangia bacterium]|nr:type III pantothenate kinase [Polyangia bacterium]
MLLVVDVGNTNTVVGAFDLDGGRAGKLRGHWRLETRARRTADEYAATLHELFTLAALPWSIEGGMVATVVPPALFAVEKFFEQHLKIRPLVVGPGLKTGMPILYDNPKEVGADRIVNAVAAYERWKQGCIIVDFGTATTFDLVTPKGEYAGGAIATGITTSADALYEKAAKLPRVELTRPSSVIGKNTVASMQSGLYFGYVGLTDELVTRMRAAVDFPCVVVATGGLASLIAKDSKTIEHTDEMLTLTGLGLLWERNR